MQPCLTPCHVLYDVRRERGREDEEGGEGRGIGKKEREGERGRERGCVYCSGGIGAPAITRSQISV